MALYVSDQVQTHTHWQHVTHILNIHAVILSCLVMSTSTLIFSFLEEREPGHETRECRMQKPDKQ